MRYKFLPQSVFQLVIFVLNCISSFGLPSEFFPQDFEGGKLSLWLFFFKGRFQYQCRIGAMAWPGSNPLIYEMNHTIELHIECVL